ncbi:MAG: helix-turn-helix domain-containing protein [Sinomicrobium sp.]|nr:helix-turn-helix domain-containing protein [Sinomicrobium sp.]
MDKAESLQEFYKRKFDWLPENFRKEVGHFNIFRLEPHVEGKPTRIPYRRRDFYKIMLVKGNSKVHYADQVVEVQKQALSFSNPQIPYKWEHLDKIREGVYCIFDTQFFHQFGQFQQYEVFQPGGQHIFELTDEQVRQVSEVFERMSGEFGSDYRYKFDLIRNLIFELLHFALKLESSTVVTEQPPDASQRISTLFLELLERQFPLDDNHAEIYLRSPSDFAHQLNIHVNHLNRAIKNTTGKTTTQILADRILQEAKVLLRQSNWNISEIAYALGFTEATHFSNFFKKHTSTSPTIFRNA